ncbi:MAG: CDP-glycerol glycerophosphotransferase family protein [Methanotrichaceae archaeon]|nr:CDP-glycerol glycerophosphotransferase family protein [Methanotrichaceae archaeon]
MFRNRLEYNFLIYPFINKLFKNFEVAIIPDNGIFNKNFIKAKYIRMIQEESKRATDQAIKRSIEIAESWYLHGKLSDHFFVSGINLGEVIQTKVVQDLIQIFVYIDYALKIIEKEKPEMVCIQNEIFSIEKAFSAIADSTTTNSIIEPFHYRKLKKSLSNIFKYRAFKKNIPNLTNLYLVDSQDYNMKNCNILFDVPYINDFNALIPVIQKFHDNKSSNLFVYTESSIRKENLGEDAKIIRKNIKINNRKNLENIKKCFYSNLFKDADFQASFSYNGVNFWKAIKDEFALLFDRELDLIVNDIYRFQEIIDSINPSILIVGDERAIRVRGHVFLAKLNGIPILDVQHGAYFPDYPMGDNPVADRIAAGGNYFKEVYKKNGAREEQIEVTGWPKFDIYKEIKEHYALSPKNRPSRILFATNYLNLKSNLDIIEYIGSALRLNPDFCLIVKPHTIENSKLYKYISKKYERITVVDGKKPIMKYLANSDILLLAAPSTVGLESAILDKPIIYFDNTCNTKNWLSEIATTISSLNELFPAIQGALYDETLRRRFSESRKRFAYEHAHKQDGHASQRVANLILEMTEN